MAGQFFISLQNPVSMSTRTVITQCDAWVSNAIPKSINSYAWVSNSTPQSIGIAWVSILFSSLSNAAILQSIRVAWVSILFLVLVIWCGAWVLNAVPQSIGVAWVSIFPFLAMRRDSSKYQGCSSINSFSCLSDLMERLSIECYPTKY